MGTAERFEKVSAIIEKHGREAHKLIPILQEIQEEYSYLPEDLMLYLAKEIGVPAASVYGVATFYAHFTLEAKGKYIIKVCDGTACHVKKSEGILKVLEEELGLDKKKRTSDDMLFTLETVACLGACGLAPVVVVNDKVHGAMTPEKTRELIQAIRKEEAENA
ncbi:MAG: NAD(P)H-dependent oxidoreductase subunit E [Clostridia bacterium]|nr:NAD(P)H-dependent oxidoreductase subunit E [Clostridia bacterium]